MGGTTREVIEVGGPDALVFDGDWIGLDWTGWGAVAIIAGALLLLVSALLPPRPAWLRHLPGGRATVVAWFSGTLYWLGQPAMYVVLETLEIRPFHERSFATVFLRWLYAPARMLYRFLGEVVLTRRAGVSAFAWLVWYLPCLTMVVGTLAFSVCWVAAIVSVEKIRQHASHSPRLRR